jgi:hypothetical protein
MEDDPDEARETRRRTHVAPFRRHAVPGGDRSLASWGLTREGGTDLLTRETSSVYRIKSAQRRRGLLRTVEGCQTVCIDVIERSRLASQGVPDLVEPGRHVDETSLFECRPPRDEKALAVRGKLDRVPP